jgi:hypothetical protein
MNIRYFFLNMIKKYSYLNILSNYLKINHYKYSNLIPRNTFPKITYNLISHSYFIGDYRKHHLKKEVSCGNFEFNMRRSY